MEQEAELGHGDFAESVIGRRRSTSFSDDYSIQRTNDDASQSKLAAVQLGYWQDDFIKRFAYSASGEKPHRDPEINIGYWARIAGIKHYVDSFIEKFGSKAQILNIGCGFDTLYWRLKAEGKKLGRFIEVDFSSVTAKKIRLIRKPGSPDLVGMFAEPPKESQHSDLHAGDYHLVGADIRQWDELNGKLIAASVDPSLPTLVIAECVLVYMSVEQSVSLLKHLVSKFSMVQIVLNEMVNTADEFGRVMATNLEKRGLQLPGLPACASLQAQKQRFLDSGFTHGVVFNMNDVYKNILSQDDIRRVEAIENLDEMELLRQLNHHYCLGVAVYDSSGKAADFNLPSL